MSGNKAQKYRYVILWILLFAFAFGMVISVMMYFSANHGTFSVYPLNDHWYISYCGHKFFDVSRNDERFDDIEAKRNDVIVMRRKIDIQGDRTRLTLRLYSRLSSVRVSVIDRNRHEKVIFYYGYDNSDLKPGDFLGTGYHFIQLPQDCRGKTLKIMEMASKDGAFKGVPDLLITESDHAMEYFAQERSAGAFITIFMLISGIAVAALSIFMVGLDRKFYNITLIGLFSAISGVWCMCSMKAIELFSLNIRTDSTIEYVSLYLMTIPLMWLAMRFFNKAKPFVRMIFFESMIVNIIMVIIVLAMQYIGFASIDAPLKYFHLLIAFDAIALTTVSFARWKKAETPERFFEAGIFFAAGFSVIYLVYYYFKPSNTAPDTFEVVIMPIALLFMVIMMMLGYISDLYIRKIDDAQRMRLVSLAYTDEMTGLYNRTTGEKQMHDADVSESRYLIINMDLNFLKKVNDILGHSAGDRYIRTFSSILKEVFSDSDAICRMGGDEFMIVYYSVVPDHNELEEKFSQMEKMEADRSDFLPDGIKVDAAYGYAYSDDVADHDSASVYRLADQKMYQMKTLSKKGRVD